MDKTALAFETNIFLHAVCHCETHFSTGIGDLCKNISKYLDTILKNTSKFNQITYELLQSSYEYYMF